MRYRGVLAFLRMPESITTGEKPAGMAMPEKPSEPRRILVELAPTPKSIFEKISSYSAFLISVAAIIISIWSAIETRHHNKLSVKPNVVFVTHSSSADPQIGIFLQNNGLGPAQITETRIYLDGKQIRHWQEISDRMSGYWKEGSPTWFYSDRPYTLRSGEHLGLYYVEPKQVANWDGFNQLIWHRIFVISKICSMYKDCEYICTSLENSMCKGREGQLQRS
jgi:hypothetical protein